MQHLRRNNKLERFITKSFLSYSNLCDSGHSALTADTRRWRVQGALTEGEGSVQLTSLYKLV